MKRLTMLAGLDACSSYGAVAIAFARGIESLTGAKVVIRASSITERFGATIPEDIRARIVHGVQPGDGELLIHPPNFVPTPGKRVAFFTMNESTRLNPLSVHLLNKAAVVIVPSQFCAVTFSASGVNVPIRVVPLGIDPDIYRWRPLSTGDEVVFGAAGSMAGGESRKGLDDVVRAFLKAFPRSDGHKVRLKIKCHPDRDTEQWMGDRRIDVTLGHLSDVALADWYASLTCFVSASKGEGFGLMPLQSLAVGRPLISARFGGVGEFFNSDLGFVVSHKLSHAPPPYLGHWSEVDADDTICMMQLVRACHQTIPEIGSECATLVSRFTWKKSCMELNGVLREFEIMSTAEQTFHAR